MCIYVDARVLGAGVAETVTVPSDADFVIISSDQPSYYIRKGGAAAVPAGDVTDGTAAAHNVAFREVERGTTFSVISPTAGIVTFEWYCRRN